MHYILNHLFMPFTRSFIDPYFSGLGSLGVCLTGAEVVHLTNLVSILVLMD